MKSWIGSTGLAVLGIALAVAGFAGEWPDLLIVCVVLVTIALAVLARPTPGNTHVPRSAFVRGDVTNSTFDNVLVDGADAFVDGSLLGATIRNVTFNARHVGKALRRRNGDG